MGSAMLKSLWESLCREKKKGTEDVLRENILFRELTARELKFVAGAVHIRDYRAGETVFTQGETGLGMYIIESGTVVISARPETGNDHSRDITLTRLTEGDFFGELALVEENGKRSASAVAETDTRLIGFFKPDLFDIIQRQPATGVKITLGLSEVLAKRLIETNRILARLDDKLKEFEQGELDR
jgi:CRP-like cAMP-binding protein